MARILWGLAAIISICWGVLLSLYIRARWTIGHWPDVNVDDPKSLNLGIHYEIVGGAVALGVIATLAGIVALVVTVILQRGKVRTGVLLPGAVVILSVLLSQHTQPFSWYLD